MIDRPLGPGIFPDVTWHQHRWWIAYQNGEAVVLVCLEPDTLREVTPFTMITIGAAAGAFVKLRSWQGRLWIVYRDGEAFGEGLHLRELSGTASFDLGRGHGNDPAVFGDGVIAWQSSGRPDYNIIGRSLDAAPRALTPRKGSPTGLSRVQPNGTVRLVDEDRGVVPGFTRPAWAGDLVTVEQHRSGNRGVLARLTDGRELVLWADADSFTPRCATDGGDRFLVVTWGGSSVRATQVSRTEFRAPQPDRQPVLDESGQVIDLWPYILPQPAMFPRTSHRTDGHGHEMHCLFDGRNLWTLPFGEPDHWVRGVIDGDTWTFREDRSRDGQSTGDYSFTDALWMRRFMKPGEWIENPNNNLVRYKPDGCQVVDVHRLPFRNGLHQHWLSYDCGEDLGWRKVAVFIYDGGGLHDTYELAYYAEGAGNFRWEEYDQRTNTLRHWTEFNVFGGRTPEPTPGCWKREHLSLTPENWQPKPPEEHMTENDIRLVSTAVPPDIFIGALLRFRNEVLLDRDKIGDDAMTAGALMYFVPNYTAAVVEQLARRGTPKGTPQQVFEGWAHYSTLGLQRAAAHYDREQKGDTGGGNGGGGTHVNDPIRGQLRLEANAFVDDTGPVLPILCHVGDALSRWSRGHQGEVSAILDDIARAGYHGIRFWSTLGLDEHGGGFWAGRQVGPTYTAQYWAHVEAFLTAVRDRGLVCQLSQGDVRSVAIPDRRAFAYQMADVVNRMGASVVALFEGANESRDTGEPDAGRLAQFVSWFDERCPAPLLALSAYTGTEDVDVLDDFSRAPAHVFVCHSYRGGRWWDKVRHIFSLQYEGQPAKRLGWNGEGPGFGALVSASDNKHEIDANVYCAIAAMALLTRQAYVWFSGPGVISDAGERLQDMPGFREVPHVRALLPADVMRFDRLIHGGETWRNDRIFAAQGEVRADHAMHGDGRFAALIYGPGSLDVPQTRGAEITHDVRFGDKARLVVGRAT